MLLPSGSLCLALCLLPIHATQANAQDSPTAITVTQYGRTIRHALDSFFSADRELRRSLLLLVEPSASVAWARFDKELEAALERNADALTEARLGLGFLDGSSKGWDYAHKPAGPNVRDSGPGSPFARLAKDTGVKLAASKLVKEDEFGEATRPTYDINCALRSAAKSVASYATNRRILVVAFDSADVESDLEGTVKTLQSSNVIVDFLTIESTVSDGYWRGARNGLLGNLDRGLSAPESGSFVGGDSPWPDMPAGFLFQNQDGTCISPSGFASYSMNRIAYATHGRVFLYTDPKHTAHYCILFGDCPDCPGYFHWPDFHSSNHKNHGDNYIQTKVQGLAPFVTSRAEAAKFLSADRHSKSTRKAWAAAHQAGLITTSPPNLGSSPTEDGSLGYPRIPYHLSALSNLNPKVHLEAANHLLTICDSITTELSAELSALGDIGNARQVAIARYTLAMLQITRAGLLGLIEFSPRIPHEIESNRAYIEALVAAGEMAGSTPQSIHWSASSICHGLAGHVRRAQPGDRRKALAELAISMPNFERIAGGTPIGYAFHRASLPTFFITYPGTVVAPRSPRPGSTQDPGPTTPRRPGGSAPTGPTTGGGR